MICCFIFFLSPNCALPIKCIIQVSPDVQARLITFQSNEVGKGKLSFGGKAADCGMLNGWDSHCNFPQDKISGWTGLLGCRWRRPVADGDTGPEQVAPAMRVPKSRSDLRGVNSNSSQMEMCRFYTPPPRCIHALGIGSVLLCLPFDSVLQLIPEMLHVQLAMAFS